MPRRKGVQNGEKGVRSPGGHLVETINYEQGSAISSDRSEGLLVYSGFREVLEQHSRTPNILSEQLAESLIE
jgi:hypothetical protein